MRTDGNISKPFPRYKKILAVCFGVVLLIGGWQLLHMLTNDLVVASPFNTFERFFSDLFTWSFWQSVLVTLGRFLIGLIIGSLGGIALGVLAGLYRPVQFTFEPVRWLMLTVPPVMLIMISMILFGIDDQMCIFVQIIVISPIMYLNTKEGIQSIDKKILEMARVFKMRSIRTVFEIYLPGVFSYINAALIMCTGLGIRIVILTEVLGAHNGIGYRFAMAKTNLQVTEIYSWILGSLFIVGLIEFGFLMPIKRIVNRWK